jgi:hypothetical protein
MAGAKQNALVKSPVSRRRSSRLLRESAMSSTKNSGTPSSNNAVTTHEKLPHQAVSIEPSSSNTLPPF